MSCSIFFLEVRDAAFPFLNQHSGMASTVSGEQRDTHLPSTGPAVDAVGDFFGDVSVSAPYLEIMLFHA